MKQPAMNLITAALVLAMGIIPVGQLRATSVIGSIEPTQIANNLELVAQYKKQIEQVTYQTRQYQQQLKALRQLDPKKLDSMLRGVDGSRPGEDVMSLLAKTEIIDARLGSLFKNFEIIHREGKIAWSAMEVMRGAGMKFSEGDYLPMMELLAKESREGYRERLIALGKAAIGAESDMARVNTIVKESKNIETHVEGLQSLVQTNGIMSAQLGGLRETMRQAVVSSTVLESKAVEAGMDKQMEEKRRELFINSNMLPINGQPLL